MTPRTIQLQARVARLDAILFARNPYGVEEEEQEQGIGQIGKFGAGAGAVGGLAGGLMLPGIAKRTMGVDVANRNAQAQRTRTARTQDRMAAANGISNERVAGAGLKTTGRHGWQRKLRNANFRGNRRLAGMGMRGRGIAGLGLGLLGGAVGSAAGNRLDSWT